MNDRKTRTLVSLLKWFGRIKPATRLRIGACLGWLAPRLARSRARIVRRNLELCFPDQPAAVREQWVADHFRALAQSIVDRGVLSAADADAIDADAAARVEDALRAVLESPAPDAAELDQDFFAELEGYPA